jgi:hypothetical protein
MLFASSTNFISEVSTVANDTLGGVSTYLYLILGVIVAFFVLERLLKAIYPSKYNTEIEYIEKE